MRSNTIIFNFELSILNFTMDLSIIILNYKTKGLVKYCIKNAQTAAQGLDYEIIVIDNGSNDGCGEMVRQNFPEVKFIQNKKNIGFGAGNNCGIRLAQGRYIMTLNPDVTALEDSIKKMVEFMDANPQVGCAGPKLINADGSHQHSARKFMTPFLVLYRRTPLGQLARGRSALNKFLYLDWDHNDNRPVDWLFGACLIARKEVVDQIGAFDERYFLYFEDMDWCRRFWEKGHQVFYVADAKMVHLHERASETEPWEFIKVYRRTTRWHLISGIKYFLKYHNSNANFSL